MQRSLPVSRLTAALQAAVARSFSLPVLYRRKHGWKCCLNAITKQIGNSEKTIAGNSINLYQTLVTINGVTIASNQVAG